MLLGVQHIVLDAALFQQLGQRFALFHTDGAHQHGLTLGVTLRHLLDDGVVLAVDGLVNAVRQVLAGTGLVGGNADDLQTVNLAEFVRLGGSRTGHTGQLVVHAEVVLEGDGGQRLAFCGHVDAFLGFDGLMQTFVEAAAVHQAAGELVHDDDFAVLDDVIGIPVHDAPGLDGTVDVMAQRHVVGIGQILHAKVGFGLLDAGLGQGGGLALFVHHVVAVHLFLGGHLVVQFHDDALLQGLGKVVGALVHGAGIFALAADDQRGTGLVDEDGVHLVHDGVGMAALYHVGLVDHHVVPQVVKAELVVGAVSNVGVVGLFAVGGGHTVDHQTHGQAQETVHLAHPFAVTAGQVIVDGDHMDTLAGQSIEVDGHGGHQRLAFTGLHLGNAGAVKHNAADDLYGIGFKTQHTPVRFPTDSKGLGQQIVQRFTLGQPVFEFGGFGLQLLIGQLLHLRLQRQHFVR